MGHLLLLSSLLGGGEEMACFPALRASGSTDGIVGEKQFLWDRMEPVA